MNLELEMRLVVAREAVKAAGMILLQNRFEVFKKLAKGNYGDFTTELDLELEKIIKDTLLTGFPSIPVIGEETGLTGGETSEEVWYVDPLDGTKAFFKGNVAFVSVSICLVRRNNVSIGVVFNPFTDTLYAATSETPTTINDLLPNGGLFSSQLSDSRIILDFSRLLSEELKKSLVSLELEGSIARVFRYEGSVAQHLCLIAAGVHDGGIFWGKGEKGNFWDIGAGLLICQQVGLEITDFNGERIRPTSQTFSQIIVGSKAVHKQLLELVTKLQTLEPTSLIQDRASAEKKAPSRKKTTRKKAPTRKTATRKKAIRPPSS
ncbi:MAG TPA: inositol monophosphatase [Candidatus Hodarchaeales archaeon]|nr:inositol monophosphatase [Candidatus Hodarchaeales archaeon]